MKQGDDKNDVVVVEEEEVEVEADSVNGSDQTRAAAVCLVLAPV